MKSGTVAVLTALIALIALCATCAHAELLSNPGFEIWAGSNIADNWTQYTTTGVVAGYKGTSFTGDPPVSAHGGAEWQRMKLGGSGYEGGVYQRFASTPGTQYIVSAWLLTRLTQSTQVEAKLGVDPTGAPTPGGSTIWSGTVTGDSVWTRRVLNVTATGSYVTVFLNGRHPAVGTEAVNVFFDDASALACSSLAAPSSPAANPAVIYPGGSSTLTAAVDSGCTVDWHTGSCGGPLAGSGVSLVVFPNSTTTYYPRTRQTATGCLSVNCGAAVTVTVSAHPVVTITPSNMAYYGWQVATSNGGTAQFTTGGPAASECASDSVWPAGRGGFYATCGEVSGLHSTPSTAWLGLDKLYVGSTGTFKSLELVRLNQIKKIEYKTYVPRIPTLGLGSVNLNELHYPKQPIHLCIATTKDSSEPYPNRRWYVNMPWPLSVHMAETTKYGYWDRFLTGEYEDGTAAGWYCAWVDKKWDTWAEMVAEVGSQKLVPTSTFWQSALPRPTRGWKSCGYVSNSTDPNVPDTDPPGDINSTGTGTAINFYVGARDDGATLPWYGGGSTAWWRESYGFRGHLDQVTIGVEFDDIGYVETTYDFEPDTETPDTRTVAMSQASIVSPSELGVPKVLPAGFTPWRNVISKGLNGANGGAIRVKCFGRVLSYYQTPWFGCYFDLDDGSAPISDPYDPPYPWNPEEVSKEESPYGLNLYHRPLPVRVHIPYVEWPPEVGEYWSVIGYPLVHSFDHPVPIPSDGTEVKGQLYLYSTIENCHKLWP